MIATFFVHIQEGGLEVTVIVRRRCDGSVVRRLREVTKFVQLWRGRHIPVELDRLEIAKRRPYLTRSANRVTVFVQCGCRARATGLSQHVR